MTRFPQPDWKPVQPFPFAAARRMFTGPSRLEGLLSLRYFQKPDGCLAGVAAFGPKSEGAPGRVHGGMILTVLDEALGAAAWLAGHPALTVGLDTEIRAGVPVHAELLVETKVLSARHRIVRVEGALLGPDGKLYASARGRFMVLGAAERERLSQ